MIDEHDNLIGLIYDGVRDDSQWALALETISNFANSAGVALGMQDMRTHQFRSLGAHGVDLGLHHTYRRLAPGNRVWQEIGRRRLPLTDQMVMLKGTFERTELFADWFKHQSFRGVMAYPALFQDAASAVLVAFRARSQAEFEPADLATLGRFAGHFGRALAVRLELERTARDLFLVNHMLDDLPRAVFLVDRAFEAAQRQRRGRDPAANRQGTQARQRADYQPRSRERCPASAHGGGWARRRASLGGSRLAGIDCIYPPLCRGVRRCRLHDDPRR